LITKTALLNKRREGGKGYLKRKENRKGKKARKNE
jgi:hypothetical protein